MTLTAILDIRTPPSVEQALIERGYVTLKLPPHPALPAPVASHPDMLVFFAHDMIHCGKAYMEIARLPLILTSARARHSLRFVSDPASDYPNDVTFNIARVGSFLFGHASGACERLRNHPDYRFIPVKQGYAKCSTIPVGDHALITEDPSIAAAANAVGIEVLQVAQNAVELPGYNTGFLGGAASYAPYGKCKEILFSGNLSLHPNGKEIMQFCNQHGMEAVSLTEDPLLDLGTIFLI